MRDSLVIIYFGPDKSWMPIVKENMLLCLNTTQGGDWFSTMKPNNTEHPDSSISLKPDGKFLIG